MIKIRKSFSKKKKKEKKRKKDKEVIWATFDVANGIESEIG